jgi:hypothetical protein
MGRNVPNKYTSQEYWNAQFGSPPPPVRPKAKTAVQPPRKKTPSPKTLNNFENAPRTRRTLNNYARDWLKVNLHGKPLNRRLALLIHPNKHRGNKRAEELTKLLTQLLANRK